MQSFFVHAVRTSGPGVIHENLDIPQLPIYILDRDLDNHDDVRALREDLAYMRRQREGTEALKRKINNAAWTALPVVVIGWLAWMLDIFKEGARDAFLVWLNAK